MIDCIYMQNIGKNQMPKKIKTNLIDLMTNEFYRVLHEKKTHL